MSDLYDVCCVCGCTYPCIKHPNAHSAQRDQPPSCHDCGTPIGQDAGPPDGWQLEDGRTVCYACCVKDTKAVVSAKR